MSHLWTHNACNHETHPTLLLSTSTSTSLDKIMEATMLNSKLTDFWMRSGSVYLAPASWCGSERGGSWRAGHTCWTWCRSRAAPECRGWPCLWRSGTTRSSSSSDEDREVLCCVISQSDLYRTCTFSTWEWLISTYLVHCQIYASVGDDAQDIGNVALVKRLYTLLLQDLLGTVKHSWVLSGLPQGQTGFHHLQGRRLRSARPHFNTL